MKKFIKKTTMNILPIFIAFGLTGYFTILVLKFPLVGLEVMEKNNQWIIEKIYNNGWASTQPIEEGDILKLVDGKKTGKHSTITWFRRVEMANSITILDKNLNVKTYHITNSNLNSKYEIYLLLPLLFNVTTISLSIFLCLRTKDDRSAIILIYFLLSIGICYLSAFVSARGDILGRILNTITFPGSIILFAHFIKSYLVRFELVFIKFKSLLLLYILNFIVLLMVISILIFSEINFHMEILQLYFFILLICYLLFHLIRFYVIYKDSEGGNILKILWVTLIIAFSPFVCLYAIPTIFFERELGSAEATASFLIIIPLVFVYLQMAEKLFDMEFLLNRLRYYSLLSLPFTIFTVLLLSLFPNIKLFSSMTILSAAIFDGGYLASGRDGATE